MKLRTLKHYTGAALMNLFLNRLMTIASILTVASCIFIVSVFYLLVANVNHMFVRLQDDIGIVALVSDDVPPEQMIDIFDKIMVIPNVRQVAPVSPEDEMRIIESMFGVDTATTEAWLIENPLRRAFSVDLDDIQFHDEVVVALEALAPYGVEHVRSEQELANILWGVTNVVQTVSIVVILILAMISIVIIINTIRITVSSRQAEISIMKYVGATDWFIRWPFVIEGLLIGLFGALIPVIICVLGYNSAIGMITNVPMLDFMYFLAREAVLVYVVPLALALGAFIGLFGSIISIRQYLKV